MFYDEDLEPLRKNHQITYDEFKSLKRTKGEPYDLFRWDNYIIATYYLQPNWFNTNIFLTHRQGDKNGSWGHDSFHIQEDSPIFIDSYIEEYIGEASKFLSGFKYDNHTFPWIVNLYIDVFYCSHSEYVQLHSDKYIRYIAKLLNKHMHNIQVLTIALSPECLEGEEIKDNWSNAFRILKIMAEIEYLKKFPFPRP